MASGIKVTIDLDESQAIRALKSLNDQLGKTEQEVTKTSKKFDNAIGSFVGNLAAIASIKAFDFLRQQVLESFNTFQQFETGLINVAKTANLTTKEVDTLSKNVLQLSREIPASTEELLSIATAAGQLGVTGTKNISLFAETVAKLGRVSNLEGEEAATTLTRILNVTRENIGTIDTFASVIVSLGNNFAATESEIALVTNEVARATAQFGVSASEAAALSATLRSVGVRAEEAGGVLSKSFVAINQAVNEGGKNLQKLEEITGKSGDEIRKQFGKDAIGFFRDFVGSLNNVEGGIANSGKALESLGITGIRVQKVIPVLAQNIGEFDRALGLMNTELQDSTALQTEFEKSMESSASKTQLLENAVERARVRLGEKLASAFEKVAPFITDYVDKIGKADIEIFAESTEDVAKLTKELRIYENQLNAIANSPLPDFLLADPSETSDKIKVLKDRISELNEETSKNTLASLRAELKELDAQAKNADPILVSIYGTPEQITARRKVILEQLDNLEKQAILTGAKRVEEQEDAKTQAQVDKIAERKSILDELRLAEKAEADTRLEEEKLAKQLANEEEFQFLQDNLGKEQAARELNRISQIENEKKRNEELKKLRGKAVEEEKASLINLQQFENLTNRQKIQAQKDTLQTISTLTGSTNDTLFAIGKASALTLAAINVSEGVTKALAAFPPPFNFAAASAVGAAGAVQIANIASSKKPSAGSFENGGIIGGNSFSGDNLQANVNSGEAVFNRRQQENLFRAVDSGNLGGGPSVTINNPVLLEQGAVNTLIDQINDALEFNNKTLGAVS